MRISCDPTIPANFVLIANPDCVRLGTHLTEPCLALSSGSIPDACQRGPSYAWTDGLQQNGARLAKA